MRPIDDVAYELSNLVKLIISCRSPVLTLFEQYFYLVQCPMYNPSDIDNIHYVLISSVSDSPSYCIDGRIKCNIYRKPAYIQHGYMPDYNIFCYNDTYDVHYCTSIKHFAKTSRCCPY